MHNTIVPNLYIFITYELCKRRKYCFGSADIEVNIITRGSKLVSLRSLDFLDLFNPPIETIDAPKNMKKSPR